MKAACSERSHGCTTCLWANGGEAVNEFNRIEAFVAQFDSVPSPFGPGDDAALLRTTRGLSCVTTDAVVEGVHFTRPAFSLEDIGHKALAVNLSDLAAMGATPTWAVCALGLPKGFKVAQLRALGQGMAALARVHHVKLVGGNVTSNPVLSVTLTVAGTVRRPLLRSSARVGDVVYVSGLLGLGAYQLMLPAQRRPAPHLAWSRIAAPFVNAAIDVSDGLLQDLGHIAKASKVGIDVQTASITLDPVLVAHAGSTQAALRLALTGGEDYVLAVTVAAKRTAKFEAAMRRAGLHTFAIGRATRGRAITVDRKPGPTRMGHQHT